MTIKASIQWTIILAVSLGITGMSGCDPDHKKKCEWYMMPDQDHVDKVEGEFIPICVRNFNINKQDCRMRAKIDFARAHYNKKFRYDDLKFEGVDFPKTVIAVKTCD